MDIVYTVFNQSISMLTELWSTALGRWGIFGTFIIFYAILRRIARTFNKLKS